VADNKPKGLLGDGPVESDDKGYRSIYVHFECREDMEEFRRVTGLDVNPETKVIWYPEGVIKR
jgi:hypothetical protein